jgi:hypothetical protein
MPAAATGRSSEGEASVKAGDGPLDEASIKAPARAAIAPPDNMRKAMVSSGLSLDKRGGASVVPAARDLKRHLRIVLALSFEASSELGFALAFGR